MYKRLIILIILICFVTACDSKKCDFGYEMIDNKCMEVVLECEEGYNLINNECVKTIEEKDIVIEYFCDEGYELFNDVCVRYEYDEIIVDWYCPSGYTMMEDKYPDICYKESIVPVTIQQYYCPRGYTLSDTKCIKSDASNAKEGYMCSMNGIYNSRTGLCHLIGVFSSCPAGTWHYSGSGNYRTCVSYPTKYYECSDGMSLNNDKCVTTEIIDASYIRGCDGNDKITDDGLSCIKTEYVVPSYDYYCDSGYELTNLGCVKTIYGVIGENVYCETGYEMVSDKCIIYDRMDPVKVYK